VKRREFITLLGSAAAWPLAARAQQGERMRRIGVLMGTDESDPNQKALVSAFVHALADLGWRDGRNIGIDYRWASGDTGRLREQAAELCDRLCDGHRSRRKRVGLEPGASGWQYHGLYQL
jgi:putative ABC transport system substrate-binding protein